jgi:hypothetical protein
MKKLIFVWIITACVSLVSCSKEESIDVNQDRIYVFYDITYTKGEDLTKVKAVFRFGNKNGTLLKLTKPSTIKFNDDILDYNETFSFYYKDYKGLLNSGTFTWKDVNGKEFKNSYSSLECVEFPASFVSLKQSENYSLSWTGSPIAEKQSITVSFKSDNSIVFASQSAKGATDITIKKDDASKLNIGKATATIKRETEMSLNERTGAGGKIALYYVGETKSIDIKK